MVRSQVDRVLLVSHQEGQLDKLDLDFKFPMQEGNDGREATFTRCDSISQLQLGHPLDGAIF